MFAASMEAPRGGRREAEASLANFREIHPGVHSASASPVQMRREGLFVAPLV